MTLISCPDNIYPTVGRSAVAMTVGQIYLINGSRGWKLMYATSRQQTPGRHCLLTS